LIFNNYFQKIFQGGVTQMSCFALFFSCRKFQKIFTGERGKKSLQKQDRDKADGKKCLQANGKPCGKKSLRSLRSA
jgi:hypothetical protein